MSTVTLHTNWIKGHLCVSASFADVETADIYFLTILFSALRKILCHQKNSSINSLSLFSNQLICKATETHTSLMLTFNWVFIHVRMSFLSFSCSNIMAVYLSGVRRDSRARASTCCRGRRCDRRIWRRRSLPRSRTTLSGITGSLTRRSNILT